MGACCASSDAEKQLKFEATPKALGNPGSLLAQKEPSLSSAKAQPGTGGTRPGSPSGSNSAAKGSPAYTPYAIDMYGASQQLAVPTNHRKSIIRSKFVDSSDNEESELSRA